MQKIWLNPFIENFFYFFLFASEAYVSHEAFRQSAISSHLIYKSCRNDFAQPTETEEEDMVDESERMVLFVADRLEAKFEKPEITRMLEKFDIPDDTSRWRKRRVCELLAEQLTQQTDDEDEEEA